ncbi:MAG: AAA family ATPase [Bacteroidota bacterium]
MILILNGSIATGKTTLSWQLHEQLHQSVLLDGDYICTVNPSDIYDEQQTLYLFDTIRLLIEHHQGHGYVHFVVNYVFENAQQLQALLDRLAPLSDDIHCFWLSCTEAEQARRIHQRQTDQVEWELKRAVELNGILRRASEAGFIGREIPTAEQEPADLARQILRLAREGSG